MDAVALTAMEDVGFIGAVYVVTFLGSIALGLYYVRRGRKLAAQLPPDDKPWS